MNDFLSGFTGWLNQAAQTYQQVVSATQNHPTANESQQAAAATSAASNRNLLILGGIAVAAVLAVVLFLRGGKS